MLTPIYSGVGEYSTISNVARMEGAPAWTASLWVYVISLAAQQVWLSKSNNGVAPLIFEIQGSPTRELVVVWDNAGTFGTGTTAVSQFSTATWTHVAAVFNGAGATNAEKWKLYVNGVNIGLTFAGAAPVATLSSGGTPVHVAIRAGGASPSNISVSNIKMWDVALTPQEVANDVLSYVPCRPENVRVWVPLLGKTDTTSYADANDAVVAHTIAGADGSIPDSTWPIWQLGSRPPYPSRRSLDGHLRRQAVKKVPFYPGFHRGM